MQKPPPVYNPEFVTRPERDAGYKHFEDATSHPFMPLGVAPVPRVNAWWMAEAALATYWEPPGAAAIYASAGLDCEFVSGKSTDAYIAVAPDWLVVAFRGTEPDQWEDIVTDAGLALVPWSTGLVHCGFSLAVNDIWPALTDVLARLSPGRQVWFTGHSLGAALATLAANKYPDTRGAVTFGSPRVGDGAFAAALTARFAGRMQRFVNSNDVVTHIPPPIFGYKHVDLARYIAADGTVSGERPELAHFFTVLVGHPRELPKMMKTAEPGAEAFHPQFSLDHMPKAYAIWCWNDFDAQGS
jgi:triacylglycerol lipase